MHEDPRSRAAGDEYAALILPRLQDVLGPGPLRIVDAGCQAGRLLVPLAKAGHELLGIDTSGFALRRARAHVRAAGVCAQFRRGDLGRLREWVPAGSFDAAVCAEVLYLCPNYRALLETLTWSLRPGGVRCVSHRPLVYYLATALSNGQPELARELAQRREGVSTDGDYHNWQTPEELRALYRGLGLDVLEVRGVDYRERAVPTDLRHDVAPWLEACRSANGYRVPAYWLVIASKPSLIAARDLAYDGTRSLTATP